MTTPSQLTARHNEGRTPCIPPHVLLLLRKLNRELASPEPVLTQAAARRSNRLLRRLRLYLNGGREK
jgi:hypothetical protein